MPYDPQKHHRRSIRLKGYDYTQPGAYYVTLCTKARQCLFGDVIKGEMRLNSLGYIAFTCWQAIPNHFPHVELDAFVLMPNHLHGILVISDTVVVGATHASPLHPALHFSVRWALPVLLMVFQTNEVIFGQALRVIIFILIHLISTTG
jgi:hypothetical protein